MNIPFRHFHRSLNPCPSVPPRHSVWDVMSDVVGGNPIPATDFAVQGVSRLRELCTEPEDFLFRLLRMTALHRSVVIQQRLLHALGPIVQAGPFAGMVLSPSTKEGCYLPKLLGCYESDLHAEWLRVIERGYPTIVNIGCADGYYAVGLARRMPEARILAYDLSLEARDSCLKLASLNGVESRIQVRGEFQGSEFAHFPDSGVFVVCDIEGAERELLDPYLFPDLKRMDLLVEMHHLASHSTDILLNSRFRESHHIKRIDATHATWPLPPPLDEMDELDKLLAVWEWRVEATPWALCLSKENSPLA